MRAGSGLILAGVVVAALSSGVAIGAPPRQGVRLDPVQPASPESHFVRAEGPHAPTDDAVELAAGFGLEYASRPIRAVGVDAAGEEHALADLVRHAVLARIGASVAPGGAVSFDLSIPFALYVGGETDQPVSYAGQQASPPSSAAGLGDPRFGFHVRAIDGKAFGLLIGGRLWAPVGSEGAYMSDRQLRGELDVGAAGETGKLLYGATIGVAPGLFAGRDGDRAAAALAAHVAPMPAFTLGVEPTIALVMDEGRDGERGVDVLVEALAALRLRTGSVRLGLAGGPVIGEVAGAGEFRAIFSFALVGGARPAAAPPPPKPTTDRDFDAITDAADACPDEAGPDSRNRELRGCPARDQDADGLRDEEDACPDRSGVKHADEKANGCPDGDNDTVPDPIDSCAAEPGGDPFGCPRYARLERNRFKITPPIRFTDDKLAPQARAALEEVAATVRANPKIEQVSVSLGTRGASAEVSDARAKAILLVFRAGYLDSSRYEVVLRDDLRAGVVEIRIVR